MKKRTAFISAILSLIPIGQPLLIKSGLVFSTTGLVLSYPEKVNARNFDYSFDRAYEKAKNGDHIGANEDYTKVIEINPKDDHAYLNRSVSKESIGDINGDCLDAKKAVFLVNKVLRIKVG